MEEKTKGQKRRVVTDTLGNLLPVVIHAANIHDTNSGINPVKQSFEKYPTIKNICADEEYRISFKYDVLEQLGLGADIS